MPKDRLPRCTATHYPDQRNQCKTDLSSQIQVKMNQYAVFHSHLNFNSPEAFAPSRWLGNEHFKNDKRDALQPFSVGSRNCIGKP